MKIPFLTILIWLFAMTLSAQVPDSSCAAKHLKVFEPGSKTVITAQEIEERGYDNLDELLASVPGLHITHDRTFTQIGLRGSSPTATNNHRVKVLLDGLPLNNPMSGEAPSGYDLRGINPEDIREVIVERTPSPVMDGNNAMLGVIRINTKSPKDGLRLNFDAGSFGELDGGFNVGKTFGKTSVSLSGRLADIAGQELYIAGDSVLNKEASDFAGLALRIYRAKFWFRANYFQREDLMPAVPLAGIKFRPDTSVSIGSGSVLSNRTYTRQQLDRQGVFREKGLYVDVGYKGPVKKNQDIETRFYFNYYKSERERSFLDIERDSVIGGALTYDELPSQKTLWGGVSYKHFFNFEPKHQLVVGTDIMGIFQSKYDLKHDTSGTPQFLEFDEDGNLLFQGDADISPGMFDYLGAKNVVYDEKFPFWSIALFARDKYCINKKTIVSGGLRLDINSQAAPVIAPELSLTYFPSDSQSVFYAQYSRSYRVPAPFETQVPIAGNTVRDEKFTTEYSNNFEIGWRQKIGEALNLNLGSYHIRPQDLVWNEAVGLPSQPDTIIDISGLEAGLGVNLPQGIKTYLSYDFRLNRTERINMPSPICKFGLSVPFLNYFNFYAEGQYEGARETIYDYTTLPYFLMNTNLLFRPKTKSAAPSMKWINQSSLAFRVFNVFDQFYQHPAMQENEPALYPQNGRTWQVQVTLNF